MVEITDQELWEGVRQGDEKAFTLTFDRYHSTLFNYGCKLCDDSGLVEDAVQDVFIDIWRLRKNLTPNITSIKFYLYRSLRRRIHMGTIKALPIKDLSILTGTEIPFIRDNSESMLMERESNTLLTQRLNSLLSQLPARQVEAITLRYFDEFSFPETAEIMGVSEKSVRNFIYRALVYLRECRESIMVSVSALLLFAFS
ncbi:RNA polymerase sigma factor [Persicitalea jodogahamensis]|uniref:RNA polymerase sigma-70 factor n=1 Tax=Persicitalea jodogahamensis TaxID=402147 RepID=A0A8J3DCH6_9BACT|nr:RNA polymerase sigma factor [Persicitalea jodogahamensis]GHB82307.1 RNA polymerase sigma-70 factor [Persicitalea jodogahamensis]